MKTQDLTGPALDWAVAKCEYPEQSVNTALGFPCLVFGRFNPSVNWEQGGPIIERERIGTWDSADSAHQGEWAAATQEWMSMDVESAEFLNSPMPYHGPTPLIAAMRCYVASRLGDTVDIPEELV